MMLLAAEGIEHFVIIGFEANKAICIRNDGAIVRKATDNLLVHGTAPANWYTNECSSSCSHPARDYHCNHVSWAQMWTY